MDETVELTLGRQSNHPWHASRLTQTRTKGVYEKAKSSPTAVGHDLGC